MRVGLRFQPPPERSVDRRGLHQPADPCADVQAGATGHHHPPVAPPRDVGERLKNNKPLKENELRDAIVCGLPPQLWPKTPPPPPPSMQMLRGLGYVPPMPTGPNGPPSQRQMQDYAACPAEQEVPEVGVMPTAPPRGPDSTQAWYRHADGTTSPPIPVVPPPPGRERLIVVYTTKTGDKVQYNAVCRKGNTKKWFEYRVPSGLCKFLNMCEGCEKERVKP